MAFPLTSIPGSNVTASKGIVGQITVTPQQFGAVANGSHDDTTAVQAAITFAGTNDVSVYFPPGTYAVSDEIAAHNVRLWGQPENSRLLAIATIRSVMRVTGTSEIFGLVLDANFLAKYAAIRGDTNSRYTKVQFNNAIVDGIRAYPLDLGATVSATTQTGPGPAITAALADSLFYLGSATPTIKIIVGGALGTATYAYSGDGVTFDSVTQTLFAATEVGATNSSAVTSDLGLRLAATAGTFQAGTTYAWAVSVTDIANQQATFDQCSALLCGRTFATASLAGRYSSPVAAAGTITVTAGSQYGVGSGTSFLSMGARDGDAFIVDGLLNPPADNFPGGTQQRLQIAAVLSDTLVAFTPDSLPVSSVAAAGYAASVGAGWSEDVSANNLTSVLENCVATQCRMGFRFCGSSGPHMIAPTCSGWDITATHIGTSFSAGAGTQTTIVRPANHAGAVGGGAYKVNSQCFGVSILDPGANNLLETPDFQLPAGPTFVRQNGLEAGMAIRTAIQVESMRLNAGSSASAGITLTGSTVLHAPNFLPYGFENTSYVRVSASTDVDWVGGIATPSLNTSPDGPTAVGNNGTLLWAQNQSSLSGATINILDGSMGGAINVGPAPSYMWGYKEWVLFGWDTVAGWTLVFSGSSFFFQGGGGPGRTVKTTDATVTPILKFRQTSTNGVGIVADITAVDVASNLNVGWWSQIIATWNGAGTQVGSLTTLNTRGSSAGSPPFGWTISATQDATFNYLNVIGDGAHTVKWRCKCQVIAPPF